MLPGCSGSCKIDVNNLLNKELVGGGYRRLRLSFSFAIRGLRECHPNIDDRVLIVGHSATNPNKSACLVLGYRMHTIVITDNDLLPITCRGHDFL